MADDNTEEGKKGIQGSDDDKKDNQGTIERREKGEKIHAIWGTLALLISILIAFIDNKFYRIPLFGEIYHGFKPTGFQGVDWLGIITHITFISIILIYFIWRFVNGEKTFFATAIIIVIFLSLNKYVRIPLLDLPYYKYIAVAILVVICLLLKFLKERSFEIIKKEDISFLVLVFVYTFFLTFNGWKLDIKAVIHFVFITVFGLFYIRQNESEEPWRWHTFLAGFLILDFFGTGIAENFSWFRFIPFIVFVTAIYVNKAEPDNKLTVIVLIAALLAVVIGEASASGYVGQFTFVKYSTSEKGMKTIYERIQDAVKRWTEERLELATGGLYRGNVEKNKYEQLGVYIDNVRAADPKFYTTEDITIWGSVKSKTLSDAVKVKFNCTRVETEDNKIKHYSAKDVYPDSNKPFSIFNFEERDFQCVFNPTTAGSHTITLSAEYNFVTDSYHKTYFIDRDTYRSMVREKIDPFSNFGITDTNPVTTYTNGPVEIGMNIQNLVSVVKRPEAQEGSSSSPEDLTPHLTILGVTLSNRGEIPEEGNVIGTYEGRIKDITELVILLPKGVEMSEITKTNDGSEQGTGQYDCRPVHFKDYKVGNCISSCTENKDSCRKDCSNDNKCKNNCDVIYNDCKKDCNLLFAADDVKNSNEAENNVGYNGYQLDIGELNKKSAENDNYYQNINKYRTFACKLTTNSEVLGNTPITTRYIRSRARYNYIHEKSISVDVEGTGLDDTGGLPITIQRETGDVPMAIVLAVAHQESGYEHCVGSNEDPCPENNIKDSGFAKGLMQINLDSHLEGIMKRVCDDRDIYYFDCNLKVGVAYLKELYNSYREGIGPNKINIHCSNQFYQNKYAKYRGWAAALRAYNGLGCNPSTADLTYPEKILEQACKIQNLDLKLLKGAPAQLVEQLNAEKIQGINQLEGCATTTA